ncbi:DUF1796 family putative cysteine peptidase [Azospirillum sp. ST 5-10]|uniref:DUF1796 family putative cysteine peptidase n=1 Tax=unclassified Azospirillum TaxID=2630922 RepID=UPI003F49BE2F
MMFDRIVSLGGNCAVAWHLRRHFGFDRAYPFDWWVTPFSAVLSCLRTEFSELFKDIERSEDRKTVLCKRYGIRHHHDFPRGQDGLITDDWRNYISEAKEKYQKLCSRFFQHDAGDKILFVRQHGSISPNAADQRASGDAIDLLDILQQSFPAALVSLLFVDPPKQDNVPDNVLLDRVINHGDLSENDFRVTITGWTDVLSRIAPAADCDRSAGSRIRELAPGNFIPS